MELPKEFSKVHVQLLVLFSTLLLFLIANAAFGGTSLGFIPPLIAVLVLIEIFAFVGMEVKEGASKHGWKHEIVDTIIALAVAIAVWYGASFILNTSSPVSGVVSCSMLPNLYRGDFIIVQGAQVEAYEINMTEQELESLTRRAAVYYNGRNASVEGSVFSYCIANPSAEVCEALAENPEGVTEKKGAFTYNYERCTVKYQDGKQGSIPCLKSVTFKGREYLTNFSNDIIIYAPPEGYLYSMIGDIVHRAMFKINAGGETYYLTRGDNNPVLDLQVYDYGRGLTNPPVPERFVRGKVIARIPILGYFKLFLHGYFQEDSQCRTQLEYTHIE
ncbi:hypothetical protein GF318_05595 [Candidatus Micrarchaeota archaeon]|nr:hypothetical protein [Candidatus Micrarchaeota archaeon]